MLMTRNFTQFFCMGLHFQDHLKWLYILCGRNLKLSPLPRYSTFFWYANTVSSVWHHICKFQLLYDIRVFTLCRNDNKLLKLFLYMCINYLIIRPLYLCMEYLTNLKINDALQKFHYAAWCHTDDICIISKELNISGRKRATNFLQKVHSHFKWSLQCNQEKIR